MTSSTVTLASIRLVSDWAQQPTDQPWGDLAMLFRDPDGNLVNFFSTTRPGSPIRPQH